MIDVGFEEVSVFINGITALKYFAAVAEGDDEFDLAGNLFLHVTDEIVESSFPDFLRVVSFSGQYQLRGFPQKPIICKKEL